VADVIVVGGGAAGCVLAARVAETGSRSVLLLEAGPDRRGEVPESFYDGWELNRADLDWGYASTAGDPVRRKRLVGGTSWLTRYTPRGGPADYDGWRDRGNPGWGWDDVLPYFLRLETDDDFGHEPWHGDSGPLPSRRYFELAHAEVAEASIAALVAVGVPAIDDHNRPGAVGVGRMPMNSRHGRRVTTADAYLPRDATPANLTVRGDAPVAEVLFDASRASGVRLVDGTVIEAGEVVLCAGVYGSPAILLRSGIGAADELRSLGIDVRADLAGVGAGLADHPGFDVDFGYRDGRGSGPVLNSLATFHSSESSADRPPDVMFWIADPAGDPATFEFSIVLLQPRSRGRVRLRSADPSEAPLIELPALDDPADVERLAEGHALALEIANDGRMRPYCDGAQPVDAAELRRRIRAEAYSTPHTVGTCAMGPRPDEGAVVDADGRVHGAAGLTVADASIMPDVPSGFTHVPTIMIAERLAERVAAG
jgi:choline dehydrogenase